MKPVIPDYDWSIFGVNLTLGQQVSHHRKGGSVVN